MAFNRFDQGGPVAMNPYTGSPPTPRTQPSPVVERPNPADGRGQVKRRTQSKVAGFGGTKRRSRTGRVVRSPAQAMPKVPEAAPMPQTPIPSASSPLGMDWSVSRGLGNGGYRNGGY